MDYISAMDTKSVSKAESKKEQRAAVAESTHHSTSDPIREELETTANITQYQYLENTPKVEGTILQDYITEHFQRVYEYIEDAWYNFEPLLPSINWMYAIAAFFGIMTIRLSIVSLGMYFVNTKAYHQIDD